MADDIDREIAEAVPNVIGHTIDPLEIRARVRALVERRERAVLRDASFCDTCKLPKMCPGTVHRITGVAEAEARGAAQALEGLAEWCQKGIDMLNGQRDGDADFDRTIRIETGMLDNCKREALRRAKALEE